MFFNTSTIEESQWFLFHKMLRTLIYSTDIKNCYFTSCFKRVKIMRAYMWAYYEGINKEIWVEV